MAEVKTGVKVKVKICGLIRSQDIESVNECKPDYIGFVFAESRRRVTPQQAHELRKLLSPEIIPVGVFVNESPEEIQALVRNGVIDVIQTPTHVGEYLIFDSPNPGSGQTFDWSLIPQMLRELEHSTKSGERAQSPQFFLAGGLTPDNVVEAIKKTNPFAVDVSSGVETNGFKDSDKIRDFVQAVRLCS
jgi:phosphoribosylanthranilate isomerase